MAIEVYTPFFLKDSHSNSVFVHKHIIHYRNVFLFSDKINVMKSIMLS